MALFAHIYPRSLKKEADRLPEKEAVRPKRTETSVSLCAG